MNPRRVSSSVISRNGWTWTWHYPVLPIKLLLREEVNGAMRKHKLRGIIVSEESTRLRIYICKTDRLKAFSIRGEQREGETWADAPMMIEAFADNNLPVASPDDLRRALEELAKAPDWSALTRMLTAIGLVNPFVISRSIAKQTVAQVENISREQRTANSQLVRNADSLEMRQIPEKCTVCCRELQLLTEVVAEDGILKSAYWWKVIAQSPDESVIQATIDRLSGLQLTPVRVGTDCLIVGGQQSVGVELFLNGACFPDGTRMTIVAGVDDTNPLSPEPGWAFQGSVENGCIVINRAWPSQFAENAVRILNLLAETVSVCDGLSSGIAIESPEELAAVQAILKLGEIDCVKAARFDSVESEFRPALAKPNGQRWFPHTLLLILLKTRFSDLAEVMLQPIE